MAVFNEQTVKRVTKPKQIIIKIISLLLLFIVPIGCAMLSIPLNLSYMFVIAFFLFIIGIYVVWYVWNIQRVDFEYSANSGTLDISKIIALRKRKRLCKLQINDIEILTKNQSKIDNMRFQKQIIAAGDVDNKEETYYAVFNSSAYGKTLLVFSPNEQILNAMKPNLKRELWVDLFYKKS